MRRRGRRPGGKGVKASTWRGGGQGVEEMWGSDKETRAYAPGGESEMGQHMGKWRGGRGRVTAREQVAAANVLDQQPASNSSPCPPLSQPPTPLTGERASASQRLISLPSPRLPHNLPAASLTPGAEQSAQAEKIYANPYLPTSLTGERVIASQRLISLLANTYRPCTCL